MKKRFTLLLTTIILLLPLLVCLIEENVKEVIHSEKDTADVVEYSTLDKISNSIIELVTHVTYTD
ncbi:hypothetical protein [uncultured Clostridium sp.]|uniref:hypothetical protein n=1 Tax=uncultured Clostridium sp. TaxID=59620 RepID=UPI0025F4CD1E|nr:hypothetical protein [uncultured Clostridium sp.]